jgi:type I restriction enzyme S subunit
MMSEWKTYKLSELVEIKYGKDHKHLADGVIPVYGSGGIMRFAETHLYDRESILIPRKGTLSNLFYLDKPFWSVDTMFYTKIKNGVHGKYLYYLLKSMDLASMNVGSAVPSLTTEVLNKVEISLPDLPTQRQIAQILTSLDDKIELNLQMNQTLEAMAQAIFKEWFVDFNFPGFDGELVDGLPKGWRKGNLGEMISFKNGKTSPERNNDFQYPVYGSNGIIGYSENFNAVENISIVGRVGSFCGSTYLSTKKCWVTDNAIIAQSINDYSIFTYLTLLNLNLNNFRAGSGQPLLNQTILSAIPLNIPSPELLEEFENQTMPFFKKIELNLDTNKQLEDIRNTALPKLMSGNIEVMNT